MFYISGLFHHADDMLTIIYKISLSKSTSLTVDLCNGGIAISSLLRNVSRYGVR